MVFTGSGTVVGAQLLHWGKGRKRCEERFTGDETMPAVHRNFC